MWGKAPHGPYSFIPPVADSPPRSANISAAPGVPGPVPGRRTWAPPYIKEKRRGVLIAYFFGEICIRLIVKSICGSRILFTGGSLRW